MEEKKDIALSTKIILAGMCIVPMLFMGFFTFFNRIDAGDSVSDAFHAGFAVFALLFVLGIFLFCLATIITKTMEQEQKKK